MSIIINEYSSYTFYDFIIIRQEFVDNQVAENENIAQDFLNRFITSYSNKIKWYDT